MKLKMKNLSYIISTILFVECSGNNGKIIHPTKENTPDLSLKNVRLVNEKSTDLKFDSLTNQLKNLKIEKAISEVEGEYSNQFGFIKDVKVDEFNRIYILDERRQDVSIFDEKGKLQCENVGAFFMQSN